MIMSEDTDGDSECMFLCSSLFNWPRRKQHLQSPESRYFARRMPFALDFPLRTFASFAFQEFLE